MAASSSIPQVAPELKLTSAHIRALLGACGYVGATVLVRGQPSLPVGCRVSLQFGDQVARGADGVTDVTIRCRLSINGSDRRPDEVTCWQIRKTVCASADGERFGFTIDTELLLGSVILLGDVLAYGGEVFRQLRLLIADARATLRELPVDDRLGRDAGLPVLRIEARFAGDLAAGRCGVVRPEGAGKRPNSMSHTTTTRHLLMARSGCDCLAEQIVPELARTLRRMIAQERQSVRYPKHDAGSRQTGGSASGPESRVRASPLDAAAVPGPLQ